MKEIFDKATSITMGEENKILTVEFENGDTLTVTGHTTSCAVLEALDGKR